jgi:hypothetical protein
MKKMKRKEAYSGSSNFPLLEAFPCQAFMRKREREKERKRNMKRTIQQQQ